MHDELKVAVKRNALRDFRQKIFCYQRSPSSAKIAFFDYDKKMFKVI